MPNPNLVQPVPVQILTIKKDETRYDDRAREPIRTAHLSPTPITMFAQVQFRDEETPDPQETGTVLKTRGTLVFLLTDLAKNGITILDRGDKVVQIGPRVVNYFIVSSFHLGHKTDAGGPTMLKCAFGDRNPVQ